jgi:hypothetical protein
MSIVDYLYKGAPVGERAAVQAAVQNMPYSTIGKNIIAEGGFGKGSNLRGFDPNFKGGTNLFNYVKGGITSVLGGNAPGNIGGGTPAQRQLFEKLVSSPFSKFAGPVVRSALSLPMSLAISGPYAMSKLMGPSVARGDFKADEAFQLGQSELGLGEFFTDQDFNQGYVSSAPGITNTSVANNLDPNVVAAIDAQTADEQAQLPIDPVDNRNIFSRIKDFAAPIAKDIAGRTIASQALGKAGFMVGGIPGALAGMIFGGAKGGNLFDAPYIGGVTTFDPITGELISGEELDKLNARGGYYTDIARAARRRDRSIANMRARRDAGLTYGANRLKELEEQAAKEEAARQAEFDRIMASEQSQQDFYDSLNEGRGATSTAESRATAGDAPGYSGPTTFAKGGIVGLL